MPNLTVEELEVLVSTLATATDYRLMSQEHAASLWKKALKDSGFDVPKPNLNKPVVEKEEVVK